MKTNPTKAERLADWILRNAVVLSVAAIAAAIVLVEWNIHIDAVAAWLSRIIYGPRP